MKPGCNRQYEKVMCELEEISAEKKELTAKRMRGEVAQAEFRKLIDGLLERESTLEKEKELLERRLTSHLDVVHSIMLGTAFLVEGEEGALA